MSERFDYPRYSGATASLIIDTIAGRQVDDPEEIRFVDDYGTTKGGTDRAADYGTDY